MNWARTAGRWYSVRTVSFSSKAAETLGYAQSTITTQIQLLEDELGVSLFDRIGKKVFLSEKGRQFLAYANSMAKLEEEAMVSWRRL